MGARSAILGLILALSPAVAATAQEARSPEAVLTDLGLEARKTRYVFADAEEELHQKYRDAVAARDQALQALAKVEAGAMMEQGILELQAGEQQLRAEIAAARSSTAGMGYGRYSRYYRNQANAAAREGQREVDRMRKQVAEAKKQLPDAKKRQAAEAGARIAMDRAREAVKEVHDAYEALDARYDEVRAKPGVLKALEDVGRPKKLSYRLGPSEESEKIGKWARGILKIRAKRPAAPASR